MIIYGHTSILLEKEIFGPLDAPKRAADDFESIFSDELVVIDIGI